MIKLIAVLQIDSGWVDRPENLYPAYVFDNMRSLLDTFNDLGVVEIVKEPNANYVYDFGEVVLCDENNFKFTFTCMYAEKH